MTASHPLDRPVWNALTSRQTDCALGEGLARRFAPQYGPLTGAHDASPESQAALAALPDAPDGLWLLEAQPVAAPEGMVVTHSADCVQMVADGPVAAPDPDFAFVDLTEADAEEMLALATLTRPGPFAARTGRLGAFIGVKQDGVLIAMAGERMRPVGYTEISGVCTLPDHRGKGVAGALISVGMARIKARGEIPFLHSYTSNSAAIGLYESLGFRVRQAAVLTVLARAG
jgi:ribosomal protein S18 acetylase RimI-like enzyme